MVDIVIWNQTDEKFFHECLNSGANGLQFDFDDSYAPSWDNNLQSQKMLYDYLKSLNRSNYHKQATVLVRPRSLNLDEKHFWIHGEPLSGSFFDFGVWVYHYIQTQYSKDNGVRDGPYFYIPKLESYLEARLWDELIAFTEKRFNIPYGSIKVFVHIENIMASFQMEEILYELKDHCLGLNTGRWDYIFSYIKKFRHFDTFVVPERSQLDMDKIFLSTWERLIVDTCMKRGAIATGGMAPQLPDKPLTASIALKEAVFNGKLREKRAGLHGALVAHPHFVEDCKRAFLTTKNTIEPHPSIFNLGEAKIAQQLIEPPIGTITKDGIKKNLKVVVNYIQSWLKGHGGCPLDGVIEDIATCEISRSQLWQWIKHQAQTIEGESITKETVLAELKNLPDKRSKQVNEIVISLLDTDQFVSFLSNHLYDKTVKMPNQSKL